LSDFIVTFNALSHLLLLFLLSTRSAAVAVKPRSRANNVKERWLEVEQHDKRSEKQIRSERAKTAAGSFFVSVSLSDNKISNIWRQ
jgi:hypothetical protein